MTPAAIIVCFASGQWIVIGPARGSVRLSVTRPAPIQNIGQVVCRLRQHANVFKTRVGQQIRIQVRSFGRSTKRHHHQHRPGEHANRYSIVRKLHLTSTYSSCVLLKLLSTKTLNCVLPERLLLGVVTLIENQTAKRSTLLTQSSSPNTIQHQDAET